MSDSKLTLWLGTSGNAIYQSQLDRETGSIATPWISAEIERPGFLTVNHSGTRLYSLCRCGTPTVASFAVERVSDQLTLSEQNRQSTGAQGSTHLALSRDEQTLLVAHYSGGAIAAVPIDLHGDLRPTSCLIEHHGRGLTTRQTSPHPHWIGTSDDNQFVLVPDLGLDAVVVYRFDATTSQMTEHDRTSVPAGSGPRHLAMHPDGQLAFVVNELSLTVTTFRWHAAVGQLQLLSTAEALLADDGGIESTGSEIQIDPQGKFLYAGIRGLDQIAVFAIAPKTGTLTLTQREPIRGAGPRHFSLTPDGKWLVVAGSQSNTLASFAVDGDTGKISFSGHIVNVPQATCVLFHPSI